MGWPNHFENEHGLYITSSPLPGYEEQVPSRRLVWVQHDPMSDRFKLSLPDYRKNHFWVFQSQNFPILDLEYSKHLVPLLPEGYYTLQKALHINDQEVLPNGTLVKLSYTRKGGPLLFVAQFTENAILFPDWSFKFKAGVLALLKRACFYFPKSPQELKKLH